MKCAFVFPGQGSQAVGMGRDLAEAFPAARLVFEEADDALGQKLSRLMFEGPDEELRLTENAQPALMAVSMAVVAILEQECNVRLADKAAFVAGHSLGEYSALAASGALRLADAARLLKLRGQAMQKAVPVGEGAMAALLGLELDAARNVAAEASAVGVCNCANDNAPGQIVVSGAKAAVEKAVAIAAERGAKRSIMLPVSAPFHCALMQPAADVMEEALAAAAIEAPLVPLVANVTADRVEDPEKIRRLLVEQVTAMVRWRESVLYMRQQEVDTLVEAGAGKVLSGLTRRIAREMTAKSLQSPADFDDFVKQI
ncbi:MAG: ACP S-malonyltransferase [Alphaproteobacteria bacterium]|nr:ACP S-malonyltransferase [Alphaproteobacteria bacterium]